MAVKVARACSGRFMDTDPRAAVKVVEYQLNGRETKFAIDLEINELLSAELAESGIPILSEESENSARSTICGLQWVVDPLDGSVNFARGAGPHAISIALWRNGAPAFGVIQRIDTDDLYVGGATIASTCNGEKISVSSNSEASYCIVASGIPARLNLSDEGNAKEFLADVTPFAKVRMIGSAAVALCMVAQGTFDCYVEREIMLWDVAAGLAIVAGAGGVFSISGSASGPLVVRAGNGRVLP